MSPALSVLSHVSAAGQRPRLSRLVRRVLSWVDPAQTCSTRTSPWTPSLTLLPRTRRRGIWGCEFSLPRCRNPRSCQEPALMRERTAGKKSNTWRLFSSQNMVKFLLSFFRSRCQHWVQGTVSSINWYKPGILKLRCAPEPPGGLVKSQSWPI